MTSTTMPASHPHTAHPSGDSPSETDPLLVPAPKPADEEGEAEAPGFSIPAPAQRIILLFVALNILAWLVAAYPLWTHPALLPAASLSYVLGLRHALDADHIAAIDLSTRRLIAAGQRPVSVGTFFALGHSTIVVATCIAVAATGGILKDKFGGAEELGAIIGGAVSGFVLVVFCLGNGWVLWGLVNRARGVARDGGVEMSGAVGDFSVGAGFLSSMFGRLFKIVDRPWKMFPLGVLFGLGFDTSSEIAILGIASLHAVQGTSIWLILIFPMLFTAGMALLDTTDGALMSTLYTSATFSRDPLAMLYYSIVLTAITVAVSAFVAAVQIFSLTAQVWGLEGPFWDAVDALADRFDIIGACICGLFLVVGVGAVVVYRPWRRRMQQKMARAEAAAVGGS